MEVPMSTRVPYLTTSAGVTRTGESLRSVLGCDWLLWQLTVLLHVLCIRNHLEPARPLAASRCHHIFCSSRDLWVASHGHARTSMDMGSVAPILSRSPLFCRKRSGQRQRAESWSKTSLVDSVMAGEVIVRFQLHRASSCATSASPRPDRQGGGRLPARHPRVTGVRLNGRNRPCLLARQCPSASRQLSSRAASPGRSVSRGRCGTRCRAPVRRRRRSAATAAASRLALRAASSAAARSSACTGLGWRGS